MSNRHLNWSMPMKPSLVLISIPLLIVVLGWAGGSAGQSEPEMIKQEAQEGMPSAELLYGLSLAARHGERSEGG